MGFLKKTILLLFLLLFIYYLLPAQIINPNNIPGLQLWLKADSLVNFDAGYNVSQWSDCSGNNNNAIQPTSSNKPIIITNALNSKPVIRFDGTDDWLQGTTIPNINTSSMTIFIVVKYNNTNVWAQFFSINNLSNGFWIYNQTEHTLDVKNNNNDEYTSPNTFPASVFNMVSFVKNINISAKAYINGQYKTWANYQDITQSFTNNNYIIGDYSHPYQVPFNGDIAEIIVYNQALPDSSRQAVENYLSNKYGGSVSLGTDINVNGFCNTSLDAGNQFTNFEWSTGETTQTISVNTSDTISVKAMNFFGAYSYDTIVVNYPPKIILHDTLFCSGNSVLLSTGLSGSYTYLWSNGQTTSTAIINTPGNYSVIVTDAGSCTAVSNIISVTEDDFPTTASLGPDVNLCVGNTIGLVAPIPLPSGLTYNWSTSASAPIIAITTSGAYSVTVTDINNCVASDTINVTIVGTAPVVNFNYTIACSGSATQFNNTSTPVGDTWLWDFGDGQTSSFQNPSHIYSGGGDYTMRLTVTDGSCSNYKDSVIHIPHSPIPSFSVSTACINHPFIFTDQSASAEGNIINWNWDFGDGTIHSSNTNPQHTYNIAGNFNVSLAVTTDSGCADTLIKPITVVATAPAPIPFTLYLPVDSLVTSDHIINFAWNQSSGASSYALEYSNDPLFASGVISVTGLSATFTQQNIIVPQTYYWRVTAYGICGDPSVSDVHSFTIFSPSFVTELKLWLKADSVFTLNDSLVTQWNDCSGNGNNAIQNTPLKQPVKIDSVTVLNNKPVIRFDGTDDWLQGDTISNINTSSMTIFIVIKYNNTNVWAQFFSINNISNGFWIYNQTGHALDVKNNNNDEYTPQNTFPASVFNMVSFVKNINISAKAYINGQYKAWANNQDITQSFTNTNYKIGDYSHAYQVPFNGDIAEILVYNQALSTTDRQTIEQYLHYKYAPPVNIGPDIWANNFCDTTLNASPRFLNYHWSTGETTSSITVNSGGAYWVSVTDVFGFHSTDTVIVHKPIIAVHNDTACFGATITLNTGLSVPYTFLWLPSNSTESSINVVAPENVTLTIFDTSGCTATRQIIITADSFPVKASLGNITAVCTGDDIGLATGADEAVTYLWSDGGTDDLFTIPWISGQHTIYVTVTNARGCVAIDSATVLIQGTSPTVGFDYTPVCFNTALTGFDDTSNPVAGSTFYWNFGDGIIDTLYNSNPFNHYYATAGYYNVTHTVTTQQGCSKSVTQQVPVYSIPAPAFQPHLGCSGVPLLLKDKSISPVGDVDTWSWTISDPYSTNNFYTDTNALHTFDSTGWYHVKLVVSTEFGCADSIIMDSVEIRIAPKIGFTYSNVCDGNPVYFNDTTQTPVYAFITDWLWDFGNGQSNTHNNPVFTFDSAGTFPVILTVKSINGCVVSDTEQVVIHALPLAEFVSQDICAGNPYAFSDSSSVLLPDSISSWLWHIGNLGIWNNKNPVITFTDTGFVPVTLTVTSNAGCQNTVSENVLVDPKPTAEFTPDEYYGEAPLNVTFSNTSQGALNYSWDFGDGYNSIAQNPSHTYSTNGIDTVTLTAYNQYGCTDQTQQIMTLGATTADIAVSNVDTIINNGNFVTLSADITNMGSRKIFAIDLIASTVGGTIFKETWDLHSDPLELGETKRYTFNAQYELSDKSTEYVCVEAEIVNHIPDYNPLDNEQCITFSSQFTTLIPYPSPTNEDLNIDFVLPPRARDADNVTIEIFGSDGKKIDVIFSGKAKKGLNKITRNISSYNLGLYTYRIIYNNSYIQTGKFVKY